MTNLLPYLRYFLFPVVTLEMGPGRMSPLVLEWTLEEHLSLFCNQSHFFPPSLEFICGFELIFIH